MIGYGQQLLDRLTGMCHFMQRMGKVKIKGPNGFDTTEDLVHAAVIIYLEEHVNYYQAILKAYNRNRDKMKYTTAQHKQKRAKIVSVPGLKALHSHKQVPHNKTKMTKYLMHPIVYLDHYFRIKHKLTTRQQSIIQRLMFDVSQQEIIKQLVISRSTFYNEIKKIKQIYQEVS